MVGFSRFRKPPAVSITYKCNRNCSYCFTANFAKTFPSEMVLSDFKKLADWLSKQGLKRIALLGGESTQHSQFPEILEIAIARGIRMKLGTNNLFDEKIAKALSSKAIHMVIVNFNEPKTYSKEELSLFYKNLWVLKEKGLHIIIRFNVYPGIKSLQHIEEVCGEFSIPETYFAFTTPDMEFSRPYTSFEEMRELFPLVKETMERLESTGVKCLPSLPLPKCALSPADYRFLEERGARAKCGYSKHGEFMPLILVQPDLSVNACARLPFKLENILEYERIEDLWAEFKERWEELAKKPLFEECWNCVYWESGECIGSCLVYKLASSPEAIKSASAENG